MSKTELLAVARYVILLGVTFFAPFTVLAEGRVYLMTNSASINVTLLHIINSATSAQSFTGTLYNGDGEQLGGADTPLHAGSVPSQGRVILSASNLEELFSTLSWQGPAMLVVNGTLEFDLMTKLTSPSGLVSNTNCVRQDIVHNVEGFDSANMTFVRFINTGSSIINEIKGTLIDAAGDVIGQSGVTLLGTLTPNQAVWLNRNGLSSLVGAEWEGTASLVISESIADLKLLNLNFVNGETFFNFSCFETSDSNRVYLMTNSNSANISATHIINTSPSSNAFTGTLYGGDGGQLGDADVPLHIGSIAANGRTILTASDLELAMNTGVWSGPAILEVQGTGSFELMTKLTSPSGLISNTNCVRQNDVHNIEGADSNNLTFVRFINQGSTAIGNITGTLYDVDGTVLGEANTLLIQNLNPKSAAFLNRGQLSSLFGITWNGEASLVVEATADDDLRLLNLNFINGETFFNFSCYESSEPTPVVDAKLGGIWTGTITSNQGVVEYVGISTDDGTFRFFSLDTLAQFHGNLSVSTNDLSGTGTAVLDGVQKIAVTINGQITERQTITANWQSTSTSESGDINLQYWDIHLRSSSVGKLEGGWTGISEGVVWIELTFNNGNIGGTDFFNCVHNGSLIPVDPAFNVYLYQDTLTNCPISGDFVGLVALRATVNTDDTIMFAIDSGEFHGVGLLNRD